MLQLFFKHLLRFSYGTTGEAAAFTKWGEGQPDNWGDGGEDYAEIQVFKGIMNDVPIDAHDRHAACVKPI